MKPWHAIRSRFSKKPLHIRLVPTREEVAHIMQTLPHPHGAMILGSLLVLEPTTRNAVLLDCLWLVEHKEIVLPIIQDIASEAREKRHAAFPQLAEKPNIRRGQA